MKSLLFLSKNLLKLLTKLILIPIAIFILIAIIITLCPVYLFRWILFHTASKFKPELEKMLTARSTNMLIEDNLYTTPRFSLVLFGVLEGSLTLQTVFEMVKNQGINAKCPNTGELLYPELQQNITTVFGFPFWTRVRNFKLEDHIYEHEESILHPFGYDKVNQFMKDLAKKPFTPDRALWEIVVVPNYIPNSKVLDFKEGKKYSCFFIRTHHAMCDGFSILKLLKRVSTVVESDESSISKLQLVKEKSTRLSVLTSIVHFIKLLCSPITIPYFWVDSVLESVLNPFTWELKGEKCLSFSRGYTDLIPVTYIKEIKDLLNVPFHLVVISGIASCIRQFLLSSAHGRKILNGSGAVWMGMPFPMANHPDKLRNHMKSGVLAIPVKLLREEDPIQRLKSIDKYLHTMVKSTPFLVYNMFGARMIGSLPLPLIKLLSNMNAHISTISIFRAPSLDMFGFPVKDFYFSSNLTTDSNVLESVFLTYEEHCRLTISADTSLLPSDQDAFNLAEEFCKQLEILKNFGSNSIV